MMQRMAFIEDFVWINILLILLAIFSPYLIRWMLIILVDLINIFIRLKDSLPDLMWGGEVDIEKRIEELKEEHPDWPFDEIVRLALNEARDRKFKSRKTKSYHGDFIYRRSLFRAISSFFFIGSLFRMLFIYAYLVMQGWTASTSYKPNSNLSNNTLFSQGSHGGFYVYMQKGKRELTLKDVIIMTFICYIPLSLGFLMIKNRHGVMEFVNYLFNKDFSFGYIHMSAHTFNTLIYWYLALSLIIGGAPIPTETSVVVFYILSSYPHFLLGELLLCITAVLVSYMDIVGPWSANYVASTIFFVGSLLLFTRTMLDEMLLRRFSRDNFSFDSMIDTLSLF